jgi:hypothetical protein
VVGTLDLYYTRLGNIAKSKAEQAADAARVARSEQDEEIAELAREARFDKAAHAPPTPAPPPDPQDILDATQKAFDKADADLTAPYMQAPASRATAIGQSRVGHHTN